MSYPNAWVNDNDGRSGGAVCVCGGGGLSDLLQAVFRRNFLLFPPSLNFNQTWYANFQCTHSPLRIVLYRLKCIAMG